MAVVEGVAEGDEGGEEAIEGPSSQMEYWQANKLCWGELVWEYSQANSLFSILLRYKYCRMFIQQASIDKRR